MGGIQGQVRCLLGFVVISRRKLGNVPSVPRFLAGGVPVVSVVGGSQVSQHRRDLGYPTALSGTPVHLQRFWHERFYRLFRKLTGPEHGFCHGAAFQIDLVRPGASAQQSQPELALSGGFDVLADSGGTDGGGLDAVASGILGLVEGSVGGV